MSERSPLRHPLAKRLLKLKIFDNPAHWELCARDLKLWHEVVNLCSEIHKHGWNADRLALTRKILKENE